MYHTYMFIQGRQDASTYRAMRAGSTPPRPRWPLPISSLRLPGPPWFFPRCLRPSPCSGPRDARRLGMRRMRPEGASFRARRLLVGRGGARRRRAGRRAARPHLRDRSGTAGGSGRTASARCAAPRRAAAEELVRSLLRAPVADTVCGDVCCESEGATSLLLLSDGKPNDEDSYDGEYGVEDVRHAVAEAGALGVRPFCITIDRAGPSYLPRIFGPSGYTVLWDVEQLPLRLPRLYRKLAAGAG